MLGILMKGILWIFLGCLCVMATGCAQQPGLQFGLRGNPNAPYQNIRPLYVEQNGMYGMTSSQFDEYKRRLDWATDYHGRVISNDQQAANAAKAWVNKSNNYYQSNGASQIQRDLSRTFSNELSNGLSSMMRELFN